jgi:hypothetical protein
MFSPFSQCPSFWNTGSFWKHSRGFAMRLIYKIDVIPISYNSVVFVFHSKTLLNDFVLCVNSLSICSQIHLRTLFALREISLHSPNIHVDNVSHGLAAYLGWPPTFAKPPPKLLLTTMSQQQQQHLGPSNERQIQIALQAFDQGATLSL